MHTMGDPGSSTVPAFLTKLWTLVEEPTNKDLIRWDETGKSFHVFNSARFSKEVLPHYFKHSNIASFVRQLNMYGFRKVVNVEQGSLKSDKDEMEFAHPYFVRDHEELLENIKRKVTTPHIKTEDVKIKNEDVNKVLTDVQVIKDKQSKMTSNFESLKRENEVLWKEIANLRHKHSKQQQIVQRLIEFLLSLVGRNRGLGTGVKRKAPLMINDARQIQAAKVPKFSRQLSIENTGNNTYEVKSPSEPDPVKKAMASSGLVIHDITDDMTATSTLSPQAVGIVTEPSPESAIYSNTCPILSTDIANNPVKTEIPQQARTFTTPTVDTSPVSLITSSSQTPISQPIPQSTVTTTSQNVQPCSTAVSLPSQCPIKTAKNDVDTMQSDLDSLKDMLASGAYSLDPSVLLGLFAPEAPMQSELDLMLDDGPNQDLGSLLDDNLTTTPTVNTNSPVVGNEMIQYTPQDPDINTLFDLGDLTPQEENSTENTFSLDNVDLNTPNPKSDSFDLFPQSSSLSTEDVD